MPKADLSSPPEAQAEADVALRGWATRAGGGGRGRFGAGPRGRRGDGWGSPAEVSLRVSNGNMSFNVV